MDGHPASPILTSDMINTYHEKGYVVVNGIFSEEEVGAMRKALDDLVESARGVTDHTDLLDLDDRHTPETPCVRRIKRPFDHHPLFRDIGRHPKLLDVLRGLIGPAFRMHGSKINFKSAGHGAAVEWHQDWAFYPHTNDNVLAVGVMLDEMTAENGPLLFMPGSHKGPLSNHHQDGRFVGAMNPNECDLDFSTSEAITGPAGACSFHHVRMVHGSDVNRSERDRRLLLYQVAAADAWEICGSGNGYDWDYYTATMLSGEPTNEPRIADVPIRLPLPRATNQGSIYENQSSLKSKYFGS